MAEAPITPEAAFRAAVPEKVHIPINPAISAAEAAKIAADAKDIREKVEASKASPALTLQEALAGKQKDVDLSRVQESINTNIGTDLDPATAKPKDAKEEARRVEATTAAAALKDIIDGKPVNPASHPDLFNSLNGLIDITPLSSLSLSQREVFIRDLLKNPQILDAVKARYGEVVANKIPEQVTALIKNAADAQVELNTRTDEANLKKAEYDEAVVRQADLAPGHKLARRINDLQKKDLESQLLVPQAQLEARQARVNELVKQKTSGKAPSNIDMLISQANIDVASGRAALAPIQKEIAERDGLIDDKNTLPQRIINLRRAQEEAQRRVDEQQGAKNSIDTALTEAKGQRVDQENEFVESLKNVARDAWVKLQDQNIKEVNAAAEARLAEIEQKATDKLDKQMASYTRGKFVSHKEPGRFGRGGGDVANKDNARAAVDKLLRATIIEKVGKKGSVEYEGGANYLVRQALRTTGITEAELEAKMKDIAFVERWGSELAKQAVNAHIQTGGRISNQQALYVQSQPWGEGLIEGAIASSKAVAELEKKLQAEGALGKGGIRELLKTKKGLVVGGGIIALILAVASGALLPAAGAAAVVAGSH